MGCEKEGKSCHFEFWAGDVESFFCTLHECESQHKVGETKNVTEISCPKVQCDCFPGRLLCGEGNTLDLTEWFGSEDGPKGPGKFYCDEFYDSHKLLQRSCYFAGIFVFTIEDNMNKLISQFFGDPYIKLDCPISGECMHISEVPGYERPDFGNGKFELIEGFPLLTIFLFSTVSALLACLIFCTLKCARRRAEVGYTPLNTEDAEAGEQTKQFDGKSYPLYGYF